ncbi:glucosamine-6-phosphate deaminase [Fontisphaera persica]|uniref:glucosamine-6-phosphate deaminase n=1 Tax=Fontisphaera persica TaxID=2974023 RepID=UPI0024C0137C|nr:glucosamine-6-phosphate deaminase [Fontisphaera persica]WCJ60163.1 glucosamine-6-phosphate deaminase [Fontisphaera persica]
MSLVRTFKVDQLPVRVYANQPAMAAAAAAEVRDFLASLIQQQGQARVILASAASQEQFLAALVALPGVDWSRITLFHMDEYLGITAEHPASFRKFLRERVESRVKPHCFHYIQGEAPEPLKEIDRYTALLQAMPIDLCCLGIGENGHIAFNDPPVADFADPRPMKLVQLDERCRRQQVGEGAFPSLEAVPHYAYTLTVPTLCAARKMVCIVPERRKAEAVRLALQGPLSTACPASILRRQQHAVLYLDADSAAELPPEFPNA